MFKKGIRKSQVFDTKAEATAWPVDYEGDIIAGVLGKIPNKTYGDLLDKYSDEIRINI
ncbi:MAG: hypothetical protein V4493_02185 [Pseudomonadota bacterium]